MRRYLFCATSLVASMASYALDAKHLGWIFDAESPSLCRGHYHEPLLDKFDKTLNAPDDTIVNAGRASVYRFGRSVFHDGVQINQVKKQLNAQKAIIHRDNNGEITRIELIGDVKAREPGRLLTGQYAEYFNPSGSGRIDNALYRIALSTENKSVGNIRYLYGLNAVGSAKQIRRDENGLLYLHQASYSTCPPNASAWSVRVSQLKLDKAKGTATGKHLRFYLGEQPILYTPYFSFPIDDRRKSGFLTPLFGYNNRTGGADIAFPYYWNIAPNTDLTITPRLLSQRGLMLGSEFRFLTEKTHGNIEGTYLPDDKRYRQFKIINQIPGSSENRGSFRWFQESRFNENWRSGIDFNYVSDDDYFQDFGTNLPMTTQNQLLRRGYLSYADQRWYFLTNVQTYQTLFPNGQPAVSKIYSRMPQVVLNGTFPDFVGPLHFDVNSEYNHFMDGPKPAEGDRWLVSPSLSAPIETLSGFLRPKAELHSTFYRLNKVAPGQVTDFDRVIPRYSIDAGLFFERNGKRFTQVLEPRIYYVYVPYENQDSLPVFDSGFNIFNFDQLFRDNIFSGFDRISNANQLSTALTHRLIDGNSGEEKFHIAAGTTFYFANRRVPLCESPGCVDLITGVGYLSPTQEISPIAGEVFYAMQPHLHLRGNIAWDPKSHDTNNGALNLHYQPGNNRVFNLGYSYLVNGDPDPNGQLSPNAHNDLHQIHLGFALPLNNQWSTLGNWSYNINSRYDLTYYLGLQYESCCWAFRILGGKIFTHLSGSRPQYQDAIYLQFLFKGLGTIGNRGPSQTLRTIIPGYHDIFS